MRSGSGRRTARIMSSTRARFCASERVEWMSSILVIWSLIFMIGLSVVIGFWKIIAIRSPWMRRILAGDLVSRLLFLSSTWLVVIESWFGGKSPMMACAVTDLPELDLLITQTIS